jgi:hypothetical protein
MLIGYCGEFSVIVKAQKFKKFHAKAPRRQGIGQNREICIFLCTLGCGIGIAAAYFVDHLPKYKNQL